MGIDNNLAVGERHILISVTVRMWLFFYASEIIGCPRHRFEDGRSFRYMMFKQSILWLSILALGLYVGILIIIGKVQAVDQTHCAQDMNSRNVCLNSEYPKIISLAPGSTELLFAAGAGKQVISVDDHSDFPEIVEQLPSVGGFPNVNVEAIVKMKPDLVVIWDGGNSLKVTQQLESLGITTFHLDAVNFQDIEQAILSLGDIAGTSAKARKSVDEFHRRLEQLSQQYKQRDPVSVFFELWRSPLMTVGSGILIDEVISLCGGYNIFADINQKIPIVGIESIIARNPQVIIGSNPKGNTPESQKDMQTYWKQWSDLDAVKNSQLYALPSDLIARISPRILDAAEIMCEQFQAVRHRKTTTSHQ
ncbi:MAG: cobalamin-binding protein [Endozoicomonas sp.]